MMQTIFRSEMEDAVTLLQRRLPRLKNIQSLDDFMCDREELAPGEEYEPTEVTLTVPDMDSAVAVLGKAIGKNAKRLAEPDLYDQALENLLSYNVIFDVLVQALSQGEALTFVEDPDNYLHPEDDAFAQ